MSAPVADNRSDSLSQSKPPIRLAVFASGQGSNLQEIYAKLHVPRKAEIALVVSNISTSGALRFASETGLAHSHHSRKGFEASADPEAAYCDALLDKLQAQHIDLIVLAGYLRKIPPKIIDHYEHRILNVHPALLPSFGGPNMYGLYVHEAVIAKGCTVTGATVHFVDHEYDQGPIFLQECCPVLQDDTPESLQERVRTVEHRLLPRAIELFAQGRVMVVDNRVILS